MMTMCCVLLQLGKTALHEAVRHNSVDVVNVLLMKDPTLIKQSDRVGYAIYHVQSAL